VFGAEPATISNSRRAVVASSRHVALQFAHGQFGDPSVDLSEPTWACVSFHDPIGWLTKLSEQ
jgi:hypothetical protein